MKLRKIFRKVVPKKLRANLRDRLKIRKMPPIKDKVKVYADKVIVSVQSSQDNELILNFRDRFVFTKVVATRGGSRVILPFEQVGKKVVISCETEYLTAENGGHFDIFFVINGGHHRALLSKSTPSSLAEKNFDIKDKFPVSGYFYFSKNSQRLMLQVKVAKEIVLNSLNIDGNKVDVMLKHGEQVSLIEDMVLERWDNYYPVAFNFENNIISFDISEIKDLMLSSYPYRLKVKLKSTVDSSENFLDLKLFDSTNHLKGVLLSTDLMNNIVKFSWTGKLKLSSQDLVNDKTILKFTEEIEIEKIFLKYKERDVCKDVTFEQIDERTIIIDAVISQLMNVYREIQFTYKMSQDVLSRTCVALKDVINVHKTSALAGLQVKIRLIDRNMLVEYPKNIEILEVYLKEKGTSTLQAMTVVEKFELAFMISPNKYVYDSLTDEFLPGQYDELYLVYRDQDGQIKKSRTFLEQVLVD